jgi:hypothetical protein
MCTMVGRQPVEDVMARQRAMTGHQRRLLTAPTLFLGPPAAARRPCGIRVGQPESAAGVLLGDRELIGTAI